MVTNCGSKKLCPPLVTPSGPAAGSNEPLFGWGVICGMGVGGGALRVWGGQSFGGEDTSVRNTNVM